MTDLLRRLVAWAGLARKPRRAYRHSLREPQPATAAPPLWLLSLPTHRSPYRADALIDGSSTLAVRPYLVAHEQQQQRRQRSESALATVEFPTAGPYWPHSVEAA
ncbi:hypothetical protein [Streptomyces sp. NPDC050546]|uniref:hypothetical protein n=1 Tax=Streptomyces sp. NPDC050546 TaxID=3365628 RepID=UPI0037A0DCB4